MMAHILFNLADVLDQACAILEEERGQPLAAEVEEAIADRITRCARAGERDPEKLRAYALEGYLREEYTMDRLLLI
jgi:hypothetical protein